MTTLNEKEFETYNDHSSDNDNNSDGIYNHRAGTRGKTKKKKK